MIHATNPEHFEVIRENLYNADRSAVYDSDHTGVFGDIVIAWINRHGQLAIASNVWDDATLLTVATRNRPNDFDWGIVTPDPDAPSIFADYLEPKRR